MTAKDRARLRVLAAQQSELANSDAMARLEAEWRTHGAFKGSRPMIRIEINTFEDEILPPLMQCEDDEARAIERTLLRNQANYTLFGDDTLVRGHFPVSPITHFTPFGLQVKVEHAESDVNSLGHHFVPYLHSMEEGGHLLGKSTYSLDMTATRERADKLSEIFGDLLPVRIESNALYCTPMQDFAHIMPLEDIYIAMLAEADEFAEALNRLVDDYLSFFEMLESAGVLNATTGSQHLAQGSYCFTDKLPEAAGPLKMNQVWGYMDSQETSGASPRMFANVVMPAYRRVMERYGRLSYGCCEAVHAIWDGVLDTVPNLGKVSISPWCDEEFMGEHLRGRDTVYLRKPPATLLGVGAALDEDAVRATFVKTREATRGCTLEIAQRDVYTVQQGPAKVRRYVEIIRDVLDSHRA